MRILREIGRILRPNGYVAFGEPDAHYCKTLGGAQSSAMQRMDQMIISLPHSAPTPLIDEDKDLPPRKSWSIASILADMIKLAVDADGRRLFDDVEQRLYKTPIGPWPKGKWSMAPLFQNIDSVFSALFCDFKCKLTHSVLRPNHVTCRSTPSGEPSLVARWLSTPSARPWNPVGL